MDEKLVKFGKDRYEEIVDDMRIYLRRLGFQDKKVQFVPISGWRNVNLMEKAKEEIPWYYED